MNFSIPSLRCPPYCLHVATGNKRLMDTEERFMNIHPEIVCGSGIHDGYCWGAWSHIRDSILCGNPNSAYVIMWFPPFGYQPAQADNRKSCNLNGERFSCPGVTFARQVSVTSVEWYCVTLRALHGRFSLSWFEKWWFVNENNSNCGVEYVINRL